MSDNNITFVASVSLTDGKLAREFPRPRAASANPDGKRTEKGGRHGREKTVEKLTVRHFSVF